MGARLKQIFVIHTTADEDDADTDADFELVIVTAGPDINLPFIDKVNIDERERGRTDEYVFDVTEGTVHAVVDSDVKLRIRMTSSEDGWLPKSIWAIGRTLDDTFILLATHPEWGGGWFDRGADPAGPAEHPIN